MYRNTANNINFHHILNSVKINDQSFQQIDITIFWPILGPFLNFEVKFFLRKSSSVTHNFIWISSTMPNFRQNLWYNSKKIPGQRDDWRDRRTDRSYFIKPFRLLPGVQKLNDMKTYRWIQKQGKKFKKPTLSLVNAGPLDRVSVLSTKCGGCHPKGLIVASSHKIKQIILKFIYAKANSLFC